MAKSHYTNTNLIYTKKIRETPQQEFNVLATQSEKQGEQHKVQTQAQSHLGNCNLLFSQPLQEANRHICHVEALTHPPETSTVSKRRQTFQVSSLHWSPKIFRGD